MKYPKEYLDEIKLRLKVSEVIGKSVKLKRRGKEFVGLSPFSNEKTPSFTINDEKGFYHCFSSGEHGNIFDFLVKTQNLKFGETVRTLAALAGMPIYKFTKHDEERENRWKVYSDILESYVNLCHDELISEKKLDVITVYMGSGKGRSSLIRSLLRFFVPKKKTIKASSKDQIINNKLTTFRLLGKIIWGITLAKEKINKLSRILKIRDKGMLVICDRYPQSQIKGYNDGPLLSRIEKSNTYLSKKISSYENKAYSKAEMVSPDLVIKLFASPRILKLRRPNMDFNQIIKKQEGIIKLKFNNNVKVVEINSEEIPERTLVKCMSMINDCIADKYKINRNQDFDK